MDRDFQNLSQSLQSRLYRNQCPTSLELGEYAIGHSERPAQQKVNLHLYNCPHCRKELSVFQEELKLDGEEQTWLDRIRVWLASPLGSDAMQPAYALRGEEEEPQIFAADNGMQIAINILPDSEHMGYRSVVGMIIGGDIEQIKIDLWLEGSLISQASADELGNFHLNKLSPGDYELMITGPEFLLHIQTLTIK